MIPKAVDERLLPRLRGRQQAVVLEDCGVACACGEPLDGEEPYSPDGPTAETVLVASHVDTAQGKRGSRCGLYLLAPGYLVVERLGRLGVQDPGVALRASEHPLGAARAALEVAQAEQCADLRHVQSKLLDRVGAPERIDTDMVGAEPPAEAFLGLASEQLEVGGAQRLHIGADVQRRSSGHDSQALGEEPLHVLVLGNDRHLDVLRDLAEERDRGLRAGGLPPVDRFGHLYPERGATAQHELRPRGAVPAAAVRGVLPAARVPVPRRDHPISNRAQGFLQRRAVLARPADEVEAPAQAQHRAIRRDRACPLDGCVSVDQQPQAHAGHEPGQLLIVAPP